MHVIELSTQTIRNKILTNNQTLSPTKNDSPFSQLINHLSNQTADEKMIEPMDEDEMKEWFQKLSEQDMQLLCNWFKSSFGVELESEEQLISQLADLDWEEERLDLQSLFSTLVAQMEPKSELQIMISPDVWLTQMKQVNPIIQEYQPNHNELAQSLAKLMDKFDQFSQSDAKELLDVLKQMQVTRQTLTEVVGQLESDKDGQLSLQILAEVSDNFEKRFMLAQKTSYQSDTTVTSKDVLRWVKSAIERTSPVEQEKNQSFGQLFSDQRTDSKMEQLHIQLGNRVETNEALNEKLINQFEKAISQSSFLQGKDGTKQLLLRLAPESLGNIQVELTEVDGEMLVKLSASTQMAKEILEANSKELRHMFAPQNILIEKLDNEPIMVDQPAPQEQPQDEQESPDPDEHLMPNKQEDEEDDSIQFEDVLWQERI